jgi:hypothetical protein
MPGYTFDQMVDQVLKDTKYPNDPDIRIMAKRWINEVVQEETSTVLLSSLDETFRFTMAQAQKTAKMPADCVAIVSARKTAKAGDTKYADDLVEWNPDEMDDERPIPTQLGTTQGDPKEFRLSSVATVYEDDSETTAPYMVQSSDPNDRVAVSAVLWLDAARQRRRNLTVNLNGVNPVEIGQGYRIIAASKAPSSGQVTITKTGTQVLTVPVSTPTPRGLSALSGRTSWTFSVGSWSTAGNLAIAVFSARATGAVTITPPSGWTLLSEQVSGSGLKQAVFTHIVTALDISAQTAYTFTIGGTAPASCMWVGAFSNFDTTTPITVSASNTGTVGVLGALSMPTVTPPLSGTLLGFVSIPLLSANVFPAYTGLRGGDVAVCFPASGVATSGVTLSAFQKELTRADAAVATGAINAAAQHTSAVGLTWCGHTLVIGGILTGVPDLVVADINPEDPAQMAYTFEPNPIPNALWSFEVRYQKRHPTLVNPADTAWYIPGEFHDMVVAGAKVKAREFIEDNRYNTIRATFEERRRAFRKQFRALKKRTGGFYFSD